VSEGGLSNIYQKRVLSGVIPPLNSVMHYFRSAARFTAYLYLRGKHAVEEGVKNPVAKSSREGVSSFTETFKRELKKGMEEAVEDMKRQKRR